MSAPQWTFALVTVLLASVGTYVAYPGVRSHAQSRLHSLLAAGMAAILGALPVAMLLAAIVNTLAQGGVP